MHSTVILGAGYTGRYLFSLAEEKRPAVLATSRLPESRLPFVPPPQRVYFDLERPESWGNIPAGADLFWCFPAAPIDRVSAFAETVIRRSRRLVVLGSTSAYHLPEGTADPLIDESWPVNMGLPRVRGEEYLRLNFKAVVLRVAGIYGPGRNPLDWIRQGRIGPSERYVNLIHVEDLARVCLVARKSGRPGESYNVSDGHPRRWAEILKFASQRYGVVSHASADARPGKRISIERLQTDLHYRFAYPDLFAALASIEQKGR